jgi:hypothetical protein
VVGLVFHGEEAGSAERVTIYIDDDKILEAVLVFQKLAQDLAALLPDVAACCKCEPGSPDDQCAEHGYGAYKIKQKQATSTYCDGGPESDCPCWHEGHQAGIEAERRPLGC